MVNQIKTSLIGLGRMGAEPSSRLESSVPSGWLPISHLETIIKNKSCLLKGICDLSKKRLNEISKTYRIKNTYTDYKQMLSIENPKFVSIATRTNEKKEIILNCLDNNVKLIYVEKPLANSVIETKKILDYIDYKKAILGYGVNRRYHKKYREVKKIVDSGEFGNLEQIVIEHGYSNLLWSHPHSIDLILLFSGTHKIENITAKCNFRSDYKLKDELFIDDDPFVEFANINLQNGISAIISKGRGLNTRLYLQKAIITIYCDAHKVEIRKINKSGYLDAPYFLDFEVKKSCTENIFENMINCYLNKEKLMISNDEILTNSVIRSGIVFSSLNNSKKIEINQIPENLTISGFNGKNYA